MKIFDMDGPIYKVGTEIADVMILTFYWIICSIPMITIGASTSAMFYVYGKKVRGEDAYVTKDFFKSFKENFKQSIPITMILVILWISAYMYVIVLRGYGQGAPIYLSGIAMFFVIEVTVITVYVLGILSRFYMKIPAMFFTAFVLAHKHIGTSALILAFIIGINFSALQVPMLVVIMPALIVAVSSFFLQKVFTKHIEAVEAMKKQLENQENEDESAEAYDEDGYEEEYEEHDKESQVDETTEVKEENDSDEDNKEDRDFLKYI